MALPNGDLITTVFDPQMAYPVDKRMQVDTLNSRDSISMFIRWEGMTVYVLEDSKIYILQGGRSNEFWKELGTGTGTGGTTFVGQFATADLLPTSGRSAGDYAFVGTGDDFVQYNWDSIGGSWKESLSLPENILEALRTANSPSETNPFATIADIPEGIDEFLELNDVEENSFTGKGNTVVRVTPNSSGLKFYNPSVRINGTSIPVSTPNQTVSVALAENAEVITITGSGGITLSGVYDVYDSKEITIRNEQYEGNVIIDHENTSAGVTRRFDTGGEPLTLEPNQWIKFLYSKGRWRKQYGEKGETTNLSADDYYTGIINGENVIFNKSHRDQIVTDAGVVVLEGIGTTNFVIQNNPLEIIGVDITNNDNYFSIFNVSGDTIEISDNEQIAGTGFESSMTIYNNEQYAFTKNTSNKWVLTNILSEDELIQRSFKSSEEQFNQVLSFDNPFGKFLDLNIQTGDINFSLSEDSYRAYGSTIVAKVFSSGNYKYNFTSDFDVLYGITNGGYLPEGEHEIYFLLKPNNKITVNVPSGIGMFESSDIVLSDIVLNSPYGGVLEITWL